MTEKKTDVQVRPGDGFLAEAAARPDLHTPQTRTGETTMLSPHTRHDPARNQSTQTADWQLRAACRDVDPEIFFPTAESGRFLDAEIARAREVCARCPVVQECLDFARDRLPYGIAGGLTPAERRAGHSRPERRTPPLTVDARRSGSADAGRAALRAGCTPAEVAREFGVSARTVCRWATADPDATTPTGADTSSAAATAGRGVA